MFIYSITNFDSRVTTDVDFLLRRVSNTPDKLEKVLENIISTSTGNDFVTFEITDIRPITVSKKYLGISASMTAKIKNTKTPFSIDIGIGDIIVPDLKKRKIPTQLNDFKSPEVNTYSLESTIAETTDAILNLMEFSSRMKDYYDIYYLADKFDFDGSALSEALSKTFENRNHTYDVEQFEQILRFAENENMQKKWKAFCHKIGEDRIDYSSVLQTIGIFLTMPLSAAVNKSGFIGHWTSIGKKWILKD